MPIPEIDRLAHEILDILGSDLPHSNRPKGTRGLRNRALVAIARERCKVNSARKPLSRSDGERLHACYLRLEQLAPVWDDPASEFQRRPVTALLRLYAALERAEMQERTMPTTNLHTDEETLLASSSRPANDVRGHGTEEGI